MQLGSRVAVAQAGGYSSDSTPSLGTSTCHGSSPRNGKKKTKKKQTKEMKSTKKGKKKTKKKKKKKKREKNSSTSKIINPTHILKIPFHSQKNSDKRICIKRFTQ